eukprot:1181529-Amphidinium_carterae.1
MASALHGLNAGRHWVFAVPAVGFESSACEEAELRFLQAFGPRLAGLRCIADGKNTYRKLLSRFLGGMPDAEHRTWWKHNIQTFLTTRTTDMVTLAGHIQNMHMKEHCIELFSEFEAKHEVAFPWLVYLRIDYDFFTYHPPLSLMIAGGEGIWVADGEDYGGLNDRPEATHPNKTSFSCSYYWVCAKQLPCLYLFSDHCGMRSNNICVVPNLQKRILAACGMRAKLKCCSPKGSLGVPILWWHAVEQQHSSRWGVIPRSLADAYFRRYQSFADASMRATFEREILADGNDTNRMALNHERIFLHLLRKQRVWPARVHRFVATAALHCTAGQSGAIGWRNDFEFGEAYNVASRLQHGCWQWKLQHGTRHLSVACPAGICEDSPPPPLPTAGPPLCQVHHKCYLLCFWPILSAVATVHILVCALVRYLSCESGYRPVALPDPSQRRH